MISEINAKIASTKLRLNNRSRSLDVTHICNSGRLATRVLTAAMTFMMDATKDSYHLQS